MKGHMTSRTVSLVLSGGVGLGAYQAGAYASLHAHEALRPRHLAGSSIGAVNAALIAGNPPETCLERLHAFWDGLALEPAAWPAGWMPGPWRHAQSWLNVVQTRAFGRAGLFRPRTPEMLLRPVTAIYDLEPLRARLRSLVDLDRLNGGDIRVSVMTTDVETGEGVLFDTARGDRIEIDHLVASCGFIPEFPPVEIGGRLLGDGGLVANAPIEPALLDTEADGDLLCFVVDLYSPDGPRPTTIEEGAARRGDLLLANQSRLRMASLAREYRYRWALGRLADAPGRNGEPPEPLRALLPNREDRRATVLYLSHRAPIAQAGPEKPFDFSRASLTERWEAGALDMDEAVRLAHGLPRPEDGIAVRTIRR